MRRSGPATAWWARGRVRSRGGWARRSTTCWSPAGSPRRRCPCTTSPAATTARWSPACGCRPDLRGAQRGRPDDRRRPRLDEDLLQVEGHDVDDEATDPGAGQQERVVAQLGHVAADAHPGVAEGVSPPRGPHADLVRELFREVLVGERAETAPGVLH